MRYPQLWEAVRTTWNRDLPADTSLVRELVDHANHVLMNQYRDESVPEQQSGIEPGVAEEFADLAGTVTVDGIPVPAAVIDTHPHVYAVGARTAPRTVVTAVLPRRELHHIDIAFVTRPTAGVTAR